MPARIERRTREALAKRQHFAAVLPLAEPYYPNLNDLVARIERVVESSGARVLLHPEMRKLERARDGGLLAMPQRHTDTKMIFLVIDHVGIWIAARDERMEHRGPLARWVNPEVWPDGAALVQRHAAWVEICDLDFMRDRGVERLDGAFNRAAAVTAAAAAVAEACAPMGVLWHPAKNALQAETFRETFGQVIRGEAALDLWLRYVYVRPGDGDANEGVVTKGLAPFTGHEIEVLPSSLPPQEARSLAFEFARMVIDRGAVPRTGMIVSPSRHYSATVRVGPSYLHDGLPVYELTVAPRLATHAARDRA